MTRKQAVEIFSNLAAEGELAAVAHKRLDDAAHLSVAQIAAIAYPDMSDAQCQAFALAVFEWRRRAPRGGE